MSHVFPRATVAALCLLCVQGGTGCLSEQRYVVQNEAVALAADAAPAYVDDDDNEFFVAQRSFTFPFTPPSAAQQRAFAAKPSLPFPRHPWVERDDEELTLSFVVANLGDAEIDVLVSIDGINEFNVYTPTPLDFHQWERRFHLKGKERVTGFATALELDEIATDLATVVNGAPNSNSVVYFGSQSGRDPLLKSYIPRVIPGLVGVVAAITTSTAHAVALELSVRANDLGGRIAERGTKSWQLPTPAPFAPVAPEAP